MSGRNVTKNENQFIFECYGEKLDQYAIRVSSKGYNYVTDNSGTLVIDSCQGTPKPNQLFSVVRKGALFAFKGASGKFITAKAIGGLDLSSSEATEACCFEYHFMNRRQLYPQDENFMFIGTHPTTGITITATPELLFTKYEPEKNAYTVRNAGGQHLSVNGNKVVWSADAPTLIQFEFSANKIALKTPSGYVTPDVNAGNYVVGAAIYLYDF